MEEENPQSFEEESPPSTVTIETEEWEQLKRELQEYKQKYLHALAEGENSRKRLQKERQEMIQYAIQKMIVEFLNPIDQLENALKYAEQAAPEVKNWAIGFEMISNHFKEVLSNQGVMPFVSEGQPFDPHSHDAVEAIVTTEYPPWKVIKEHIRGYSMGDRKKVIRPARVHVSKAPSAPAEAIEENQEDEKIETQEENNNIIQGGPLS